MADELITFIAAEPGMAQRMLAQHADDGTGRCRVCSSAQSGRYVHPCAIRLAAEAAFRRSGGAVQP